MGVKLPRAASIQPFIFGRGSADLECGPRAARAGSRARAFESRLVKMDLESAVFHDYDPAVDAHVVKRWTPERGYEAFTRTITT